VLEALRLLAADVPVTTVATRVGYATPSAFGAAFRAELGGTPARWFTR
jgi:AraC-like DNA-binding protein